MTASFNYVTDKWLLKQVNVDYIIQSQCIHREPVISTVLASRMCSQCKAQQPHMPSVNLSAGDERLRIGGSTVLSQSNTA